MDTVSKIAADYGLSKNAAKVLNVFRLSEQFEHLGLGDDLFSLCVSSCYCHEGNTSDQYLMFNDGVSELMRSGILCVGFDQKARFTDTIFYLDGLTDSAKKRLKKRYQELTGLSVPATGTVTESNGVT